MREILFHAGAVIIFVWGVVHIISTKSIVLDFKLVDPDKRLILTMEWIAEGLTLCFIGLLVLLTTIFAGSCRSAANSVYISSSVMLFLMSVLSLFTGARTKILPMKICPVIKTLTALMIITGLIL